MRLKLSLVAVCLLVLTAIALKYVSTEASMVPDIELLKSSGSRKSHAIVATSPNGLDDDSLPSQSPVAVKNIVTGDSLGTERKSVSSKNLTGSRIIIGEYLDPDGIDYANGPTEEVGPLRYPEDADVP